MTERDDQLAEVSRMWGEWARNATTDTVPDRYIGETMPDGTTADRYWWYHDDGSLRDAAPDAEDGPGNEWKAAAKA